MTTIQTQHPYVPAKPASNGREEPGPRQWSRDQFYHIASLGWFAGRRAVLLDGEIIEMAAQGNWHSVSVGKTDHTLADVFPRPAFWVRVQMPLDLPDGTSEPEPDLAVVTGNPDDYAQHPSTALLVVEIADSSLRLDRRKANAYASAAVADYWIVNLREHLVEVYRDPLPDATAEFGYRYGSVATLRPGDSLAPLAASHAKIAIADLLPARPVGENF